MATMTVGYEARMTVRPYIPQDRERVLELIAGDRLPGRPAVTAAMLGHALEGYCLGDPAAGALEELRTDVAVDATGEVVGVSCWAVSERDGEGLLLWLHCVEDDQRVAGVLVEHILEQAGRRTVHAFKMPTAIGFAGLAVRNRRGSAAALEAAGFSRQDGWSYLHHRLDTLRPRPYEVIDITECADPYGWYVRLREKDGTLLGKAVVSRPVEGTAVLEWIALAPEPDGSGHVLLEQCLAHLADRDVRELVVLLDTSVDDPGHGGGLAGDLHYRAGFHEIDHLYTYIRRP
ncbi:MULTISPECIES: hypothetical protein [unclassified Streptomyces]|uniref:hypothetical protein n=1 Tax=unclassified Streptomyces TaxID=2593676 RepID=UPI0022720D6B|nr:MULTISPECIES: hypothetical protein [unclassified Streptomyces]MCY0923545.1 hypothetical protein [Streptomyces sp. H27-G5]MCY0962685.1 hypothetical protein [Streptomyces sp. H27-H5]